MASIDLGGLNPSNSYDYKSQKFDGADADTEIWGYCTMENNSSTNKVGKITVSTNFNGGNLKVAVGSTYGATDGASGTVTKNSNFSCYVSYLERSNYIVITVSQDIIDEFTVEISFSALTGREATFEVDNTNTYDGTLKYGITNLSNCSVISGTRTGTYPDTYNCTLQANNSVKYSDCYYFNNDGVAQSSKTAAWTLNKGSLTETDWYLGYATSHSVGDTFSVVMQGNNIPQIKASGGISISGTGGATATGKNGNAYNFKATKAGTIAISFNSEESDYYKECNRITVPAITITDDRAEQHWYYSNASVEVGKTAYLSREGYNISSATPSITVENSSIISATIDSDGQITVRGKAIGTSSLTITIGEDKNYKLKTDKIYISVIPVSKKNYIKVWNGSSWVNAIPYIYFDGSWHESIAYVNDNGEWKETTE